MLVKMAALTKWITGLTVAVAVIIGEIYTWRLPKEQKAIVMRAHFVVFVEILMCIGSWIIWKNLAHLFDRTATPVQQTLWKSCLAVFLILSHVSYFTNLLLLSKNPHWFSMLCYVCLGTVLQLNVFLLAMAGLRKLSKLALWLFGKPSSARHHDKEGTTSPFRTDRWARQKAFLAIMYAMGLAMLGVYNASLPPSIKHVHIPIANLGTSLDGFRIVQVSDIHLGPTVGYNKLNMIAKMINTINADMMVLTGDLVDGSVKNLNLAAEPLRNIKPRRGKYFVSGNHEYHNGDVDGWFDHLRGMDFTVLHNQNTKIDGKNPEDHFCLAGTDDLQADVLGYGDHGFKLKEAVGSCDQNHPIILLAHQPKAAQKALDSEYPISLVLSGHTHGGQMFPLMVLAYLANPFFAGLYQYKDSYVYVSQGTQYWGIPMRIGSSMEITCITLRAV